MGNQAIPDAFKIISDKFDQVRHHFSFIANLDNIRISSKNYKMKGIGSIFSKKKGIGFDCVDEYKVFTCTHFFDIDKFDIEP